MDKWSREEILSKLFKLDPPDSNNNYIELTGQQINTIQLSEPTLAVEEFVITDVIRRHNDAVPDKLAFRIPVVALNDCFISQKDINNFYVDYTGMIPTVMVDFVDTSNSLLSTNTLKDGAIIKIFIGGNGDENYYKPIRQDFIVTDVQKLGKGNQNKGDYMRYRVKGTLNVPYGYKKHSWCNLETSAMLELFNLSVWLGLGFATNFAKETNDKMCRRNPENISMFDFIREITESAMYSPYTFFTSFVDQYNVLNFIEVHSLLSHGGKKTDVPAMIYINTQQTNLIRNKKSGKKPDEILPHDVKKLDTKLSNLVNSEQKLTYYFLSNNDFFVSWSNYIEEYTEITNGFTSITDGYRRHVYWSDNNMGDWGCRACEFVISPIDNLKRDSEDNILPLPEQVSQNSYIPLNLIHTNSPVYASKSKEDINDLTKLESSIQYGDIDTTNMYKMYFFAKSQNDYQMKCLKKCGLKVRLQNYNPSITKFSRIWVDIFDKHPISNEALKKRKKNSLNGSGAGRFAKSDEAFNNNLLKFKDEGTYEISNNKKIHNNFPRGEYNRSLSGWYVVTEMKFVYNATENNIKTELMLNRIEYQPTYKKEYDTAKKGIELYKEENKIENLFIPKEDYGYIYENGTANNSGGNNTNSTTNAAWEKDSSKTYSETEKNDIHIIITQSDTDLNKLRLYLFMKTSAGAEEIAHFPICVSRRSGPRTQSGDNRTPVTTDAEIIEIKERNPNTDSFTYQDSRGKVTGVYGPWSLRLSGTNKNGTKFKSSDGILIHGSGTTNDVFIADSTGSLPTPTTPGKDPVYTAGNKERYTAPIRRGHDSSGCIRMHDNHITMLKERYVKKGTKVVIGDSNQDVKELVKKHFNISDDSKIIMG